MSPQVTAEQIAEQERLKVLFMIQQMRTFLTLYYGLGRASPETREALAAKYGTPSPVVPTRLRIHLPVT